MAARPQLWSIAAHRGFADALVAGLIPRYREEGFGLARLTLILPNRRAVRGLTEAFVRASEGALLLPRMVVVGDLDSDDAPGALFDPLDEDGADIPPAVDPEVRLLALARLLRAEMAAADRPVPGPAALLRMARATAETIDRLLVEDVAPLQLLDPAVIGLVGDLADHWQESTRLFARVLLRWQAEAQGAGVIDPPERRNRLLRALAQRWRQAPPAHPVIAAAVTSAAPAVAGLLRVIAGLPRGGVILPDLDLALDPAVWDALGRAGAPGEGMGPFDRGDLATHPQYHLKLLLNRMGVARDEVQPWHRSGAAAAPPARSRAISNLFLPPLASAVWADLPRGERDLSGVRLMTSAGPDEEALAIAVLVRQALAVPERRVAVVTPDRALATRVVGHLQRWAIAADDSAGRPLPQTPAGRLFLLLAQVWAERGAPVPLIALLGHPLVQRGDMRGDWLDKVRALDLALRGPRPGPGHAGVRDHLLGLRRPDAALIAWWDGLHAILGPLLDAPGPVRLDAALARLVEAGEALCGEGLWAEADGRALAGWVETWSAASADPLADGGPVDPAEWPVLLRDALDQVAVRPPYGGHPRVAIYGLLEARMTRADLVICGGLAEGTWPPAVGTDPVLAPAVLRALGIPGADFRIGLAAHDFAAALGAPEVVLSHATRDVAGPVVLSRFVLRINAMLGGDGLADEDNAIAWARAIDAGASVPPAPQPHPRPSAAQRRVPVAVTALDRLRSDPYQFYAQAILGLRRLDPIDAEPSAAWLGTVAHEALEAWHNDGARVGALAGHAARAMDRLGAHPLIHRLWQPRLLESLDWVERHHHALVVKGRQVLAIEAKGRMVRRGVEVHGRADRIDRDAEGRLAIIDYKSGKPPKNSLVEAGYALQLGLIGLIAEHGGFPGISGVPHGFEYWSLAKKAGQDKRGYMREPIKAGRTTTGIAREDMLSETARFLDDALDRWILGTEPFTARLNPDVEVYTDYDQLMRLDEWLGREAPAGGAP